MRFLIHYIYLGLLFVLYIIILQLFLLRVFRGSVIGEGVGIIIYNRHMAYRHMYPNIEFPVFSCHYNDIKHLK